MERDNKRLLAQVQQKEEMVARLAAERLREQQSASLLRANNKTLEEKAGAAVRRMPWRLHPPSTSRSAGSCSASA